VYKVGFDAIENLLQIIPFEEEDLRCALVHEVANFCRRIQVNPQSSWAFALYCGRDVSECKTGAEAAAALFNLHFSTVIAEKLKKLMVDEDERDVDREERELPSCTRSAKARSKHTQWTCARSSRTWRRSTPSSVSSGLKSRFTKLNCVNRFDLFDGAVQLTILGAKSICSQYANH
jgi:hypothetical protein